MRILLFSMYYKPDTAATGLLMAELTEELASLGHDVTVVASMPHYDTNRIWEAYRRRLWVREQCGEIRVIRLYTYVPRNKDSFLGRLISYTLFTVSSAIAALCAGKQDVALFPSPSPPLTSGLAAFILRRLRGTPFVLNVQDLYPDVAIQMGVIKNRAVIRAYRALESFVYARSAGVTVISDGFRRNLLDKGVSGAKIAVMPNFVDVDFIRPHARRNAFSERHGLNDKFVVLFAGNVGLAQGLSTALEAAQRVTSHPDILFLIVGNGAEKEALLEQSRKMGLANVRFLPYQPYERVPELYSAADVCLVPLKRGLTDWIPSKVFTIMGVARPIVAAVEPGSDTHRLVDDARCGLTVPPEDADELAQAILTLYADPERRERMGARGRAVVEAEYSRQRVAREYDSLFQRVCGLEPRAVVRVADPSTADKA